MLDFAEARRNMVENQLRPSRIDDPRLLAAMGEVPRELFLPKPLRGVAYSDDDIELDHGHFLLEPLALAKMLQVAQLRSDEVALVIGCSTGYAAAVMARLAATVFLLVEPDEDVTALDRLLNELGCANVLIQQGPLREGLPSQAPFDAILLPGTVREVPAALREQLGDGGRLVTVVSDRHAGRVTLFSKVGGAIGRRTPFDAGTPELVALRPEPRFVF
ncbi:protein-L-isoaspartate O-methyltransferase [Geminicoccaceae bacterium 1502E]|nr:protein-L-isoaspartate O-methyltransferase [Geminicoccaceae bacterium 1502E]